MSIVVQLALFRDVVNQGSFAKAAILNNMDNSALSKQIKKLETALGVQLLNRSTRSIALTSAGRDIYAQGEGVLQALQQLYDTAESYQASPKGRLRITAPVYFGQGYLQAVINRFMSHYPDVQVTLFLDDKKSDIIADHFDVAFRLGRLADSSLIARKIADTEFAIVASNDFIDNHDRPTTPEALLSLPAVIYRNADVTLDQLSMRKWGQSGSYRDFKMRGNYWVNDVLSLLQAVQNGLGYAVVDLSNLTQPMSQMQLQPLLLDYQLSTRNTGIYALYPHRQQPPIVTQFIQAVQDYIGNPPFWRAYLDQ